MKLRYVASKSKFIDVEADHPRLLNMETAYKLLKSNGVAEPETLLAAAIANPLQQVPKESEHKRCARQFNVEYKKNLWYIQGVAYGVSEACEVLQSRGLDLSLSLRVLAFTVDLANANR